MGMFLRLVCWRVSCPCQESGLGVAQIVMIKAHASFSFLFVWSIINDGIRHIIHMDDVRCPWPFSVCVFSSMFLFLLFFRGVRRDQHSRRSRGVPLLPRDGRGLALIPLIDASTFVCDGPAAGSRPPLRKNTTRIWDGSSLGVRHGACID